MRQERPAECFVGVTVATQDVRLRPGRSGEVGTTQILTIKLSTPSQEAGVSSTLRSRFSCPRNNILHRKCAISNWWRAANATSPDTLPVDKCLSLRY